MHRDRNRLQPAPSFAPEPGLTVRGSASIPLRMSELRIEIAGAPPHTFDRRTGSQHAGATRLAVFDLDGTLVDTAPDLAASLNHCLRSAGLPEQPVEAVRPHAGKGVRVMLERAYESAGLRLHGAAMDEQFGCFLAHYEAHIADHSTPFPGALDALDRLEQAGVTLAICTNKTEHLAKLLIAALGLSDRFAAICGADTFARRKPDPAHLLGTIAQAGGQPEAAVMIGDTDIDMQAARACALPSILVDFGYEADDAARCAATRIIRSFDDLDARMIEGLTSDRLSAS